EAQKMLPQGISNRCQRHGRSRMPRIRLLNRVHRKRADRVDAKSVNFHAGQRLFTRNHECLSLNYREWAVTHPALEGTSKTIAQKLPRQFIKFRSCLDGICDHNGKNTMKFVR